MINVKNLVINSGATVGDKLLLTDVQPYYSYKDGVRTTEVEGFTYTIAIEKLGLEKHGVKILGKQQLDFNGKFEPVKFDDLTLGIYWRDGQPQVSAKASRVSLVSPRSDQK